MSIEAVFKRMHSYYGKQSRPANLVIPILIFVFLATTVADLLLTANNNQRSQSQKVVTSKVSVVAKPSTLNPLSKVSVPAPSSKTVATVSNNQPSVTPDVKPTSGSTSSSVVTTTSPSQPQTQTQTPLSVLTAIISSLETGGSVEVAAVNTEIPGPISDATGRPIVFTVGEQTYFAYSQEQGPNFTTTPADTASSMAIVPTNDSSISLTTAHLEKGSVLVDQNEVAVGYSTGGDS
jgi:hypothetical protein